MTLMLLYSQLKMNEKIDYCQNNMMWMKRLNNCRIEGLYSVDSKT